jgi:hypothetical protein
LQDSSQPQDNLVDHKKETIKELINSICKYQKKYVKNSLGNLLEKSPNNTKVICKYIITEQNEINIKELTKEGKIKTLIDIAKFLDFKDFDGMTKENIFSYLNRFRKSEDDNLSEYSNINNFGRIIFYTHDVDKLYTYFRTNKSISNLILLENEPVDAPWNE